MRTLSIGILICICLFPVDAVPQGSNAQQRTRDIAAAFNKRKHVAKEKYGIRREKYKEIRSEPVLKQNVSDYSGTYEVPDLGYVLNVRVGSDGRIEVNGHETRQDDSYQTRGFKFRNATIQGALLTGTKVYDNGQTQEFEGVFIKRTEFNSPQDVGVSTFGLGAVGQDVKAHGVVRNRLFYQIKQ